MKIVRRLVEDIDDNEKIDIPEVTDPIDLSDSTQEIASDVVDEVEAGSEGELTITDGNAMSVADTAIQAGKDLGASTAVVIPRTIGSDNAITRLLDKALKVSLRNRKMGLKENCNILLIGLPGSAKTASVYDWAGKKKSEMGLNLVYVNAKNNDLEAYINGYTVHDTDNPDYVKQAYSSNLNELDEPNSVLFLDEYNRQIKPHVRASLLTLINEHYIVGNDPDPDDPEGKKKLKTHTFNNLLFTIACINPAIPTDKGAAPLNDAELSRFAGIMDNLDSDPASTVDYFTKKFDLAVAVMDKYIRPDDPEYAAILETYLRIQHLAIFVVTHEEFAYDTRDKLNVLFSKQKKMLNQRSLGELIISCGGDVEECKEWVELASNFLEEDQEMLLNILDDYDSPSFENLCKAKGIDPTNIKQASAAMMDAAAAKVAASLNGSAAGIESEVEAEDDEEFSGYGNDSTSKVDIPVKTPQDIISDVQSYAKKYFN